MGNRKRDNKKKGQLGTVLKDILTNIITPIAVALLTVWVAGSYQMMSIDKANEAQLEAALKTADAQIKAAEISKVNKIEYDYKESYSWDVTESSEYMPLKKGNYWSYSGSYTNYSSEYKKYYTKDIKVKFEILEEITNQGISLFVVSNYPPDIYTLAMDKFDQLDLDGLKSKEPLDFTENKNLSGLLLVANKLFYIPKNELENVKEFIKDPSKTVDKKLAYSPSLSYYNLLFEFPLFKGQRFGDFRSITREDLSYFWYVNDVREMNTLNGDTFEKAQIFDLIYNTNPDQQVMVFRPYIGIITYSLSRNSGAPINLQIELNEYELK